MWSHCDLGVSVRHAITLIPIRKPANSNFMLFVFQFYLCVYMALILLTLLATAVPKQCPFKVQSQCPVPSPSLANRWKIYSCFNFLPGSLLHKSFSKGCASYCQHMKTSSTQRAYKKLDKKLSRRQNSFRFLTQTAKQKVMVLWVFP